MKSKHLISGALSTAFAVCLITHPAIASDKGKASHVLVSPDAPMSGTQLRANGHTPPPSADGSAGKLYLVEFTKGDYRYDLRYKYDLASAYGWDLVSASATRIRSSHLAPVPRSNFPVSKTASKLVTYCRAPIVPSSGSQRTTSSCPNPNPGPIGNTAPTASNGSVSTSENTAVNGTLSASDSDGDTLTFSIAGQPSHGTIALTNSATGAFTYTPNNNYIGSDSFTFKATDSVGKTSNTATESVTVGGTNNNPPPQPSPYSYAPVGPPLFPNTNTSTTITAPCGNGYWYVSTTWNWSAFMQDWTLVSYFYNANGVYCDWPG